MTMALSGLSISYELSCSVFGKVSYYQTLTLSTFCDVNIEKVIQRALLSMHAHL